VLKVRVTSASAPTISSGLFSSISGRSVSTTSTSGLSPTGSGSVTVKGVPSVPSGVNGFPATAVIASRSCATMLADR